MTIITDIPASEITTHIVQFVRELSPSTYVLSLDRGDLDFQSGQFVRLGLDGNAELREYSIYSGTDDDLLEFLVKEVEEGSVSRQLRRCGYMEPLRLQGPMGAFVLDPEKRERKHLFVATGTGISPFHSMALSHPELDYKVIHGVRYGSESYEREDYGERYVSCVTREDSGDFRGRVTDYLRTYPVEAGTEVFLCGNCDMIYDAFEVLQDQGISREHISAEIYF